jgi:hypothetical protein
MGVLAIVAVLAAGGVVRGDDSPTISVCGKGKIAAVPDVAEVQLGVFTQSRTAKEALEDNSKATEALRAKLKDGGVVAKDIQTTRVRVQPLYAPPESRPEPSSKGPASPKVIGYCVENKAQVTMRRLDKLGDQLDALVKAEANHVYGITFRVDEPEKLLDEARRRAMADARNKARLLASEAGVLLGDPIKIVDEDESMPKVQPMPFLRSTPPALPVAPGEQELSVTVHVVYALKRAK